MMNNGMMGGGMGIWMVFSMLFWVLILAGVIFLIVRVVNKVRK